MGFLLPQVFDLQLTLSSVGLGLETSTGLEGAEQEPPEQDEDLFEKTPSTVSALNATLAANTN